MRIPGNNTPYRRGSHSNKVGQRRRLARNTDDSWPSSHNSVLPAFQTPPRSTKRKTNACCSLPRLVLLAAVFFSCTFLASIVFLLVLEELTMDQHSSTTPQQQLQHSLMRSANNHAGKPTVREPLYKKLSRLLDDWLAHHFMDSEDGWLVYLFTSSEANEKETKIVETTPPQNKGKMKIQPINSTITKKDPCQGGQVLEITETAFTMDTTVVPFVYMVHNRVQYLQEALESLRHSDFPHATVPVIISHDGHVPEMITYIQSLQEEGYFQITQIFHPYACYDHPHEFPGDDPRLNVGYEGDTYGNPRTSAVTCAKHHFTWLLNQVFDHMDFKETVDHFLFMEEDYVVAPTVYSSIVQGLNVMQQFANQLPLMGVGLDPGYPQRKKLFDPDAFNVAAFYSGPMTLSRQFFQRFKEQATEYCLVDEYNWDWSFVATVKRQLLPHLLLYPGKSQALHVGTTGGMHNYRLSKNDKMAAGKADSFDIQFHSNQFCMRQHLNAADLKKPNGGWGHRRDLTHCLELFGVGTAKVKVLVDQTIARKVKDKMITENDPKMVCNGGVAREITVDSFSVNKTVVPFVFMVHNRVGYLRQAIDSLRRSDFPNATVPVVISHDGLVPDMVEYVQSLKQEGYFQIIQIFHPFALYDHPDDFPGNVSSWNVTDEGDSYGHPRTAATTSCKHHFTWMLNKVFSMEELGVADNFLFLEEDYIVAPTVYSSVIRGLNAIQQFNNKISSGFLGVGLVAGKMQRVNSFTKSAFNAGAFTTGPMTLSRDIFGHLKHFASEYCLVDDYNWDWSLVHTVLNNRMPRYLLYPGLPQARHIGMEGGMHNNLLTGKERQEAQLSASFESYFHDNVFCDRGDVSPTKHERGFGGWGHHADLFHCMSLFSNDTKTNENLVADAIVRNRRDRQSREGGSAQQNKVKPQQGKTQTQRCISLQKITSSNHTIGNTIVPFVYMVFSRVDYLRRAIDSLRMSDFPNRTVPVIISHDGHVPDVVEYVESLKKEGYFHVTQLFHPHACYDHPSSFPGNDTSLNVGYPGDSYGNPRTWSVTCCKHHFTWLLNEVYEMDFGDGIADNFLFMEEDYVVAPSVYSSIIGGLNAIDQFPNEVEDGFLGVGLVPKAPQHPTLFDPSAYNIAPFSTGPMTLSRDSLRKLKESAPDYCLIDDYNWDWSLVNTISNGKLPSALLFPGKPQAVHIGVEGGMHNKLLTRKELKEANSDILDLQFESNILCKRRSRFAPVKLKQGNGGWGHRADLEHCMNLLQPDANVTLTDWLIIQALTRVEAARNAPPPPKQPKAVAHAKHVDESSPCGNRHKIEGTHFTNETVIPFVFMVDKNVANFKKTIDSLHSSDFPRQAVPIIISHDGRVPEMVEYVNSLKAEGAFKILQLFHPYSCYDHPNSFPGDDPSLNEGYLGDSYGNKRDASATCRKHHFTWLANHVFNNVDLTSQGVDNVVFFDEEYLLSLDVYKVVVQGLNAIVEFENTTSVKALGFGLAARSRQHAYMKDTSAFNLAPFTSGPITMSREIYALIRDHAEDYCHIDEYNWDWSLVHVAGLGHVPHTMVYPGVPRAKLFKEQPDGLAGTFEASDICVRNVPPVRHDKGFGGWGHPTDQKHCMEIWQNGPKMAMDPKE